MIQLFRVFIPASILGLLVAETLLLFGIYIGTSILLLTGEYDWQQFLLDEHGVWRIAIVVGVVLLGLYFHDLYTNLHIPERIRFVQQLCFIFGIAFTTQALISYAWRGLVLPRLVMIVGSFASLLALLLLRLAFSSTVLKTLPLQRILFLGASPVVFEVAKHLGSRPELGFAPLGYLAENCAAGDDTPPSPLPEAAVPRLGCLSDLLRIAGDTRPDRLVVGMSERRQRLPINDLLELRFAGVPTEEVADLYEVTFGRVCTREIRPSQLIFTASLGPRRRSIQVQTIYSKILALVGIILAAPVMAVVALLVKFTSPGPVFFGQARVGLHDAPFTVYKFRSMYRDAEARTGAVWATRNDPRITPVGVWLRRLRLDELPQLWNVLRGEMAVVGPRPERPEFVKMLSEKIPYYRQRHSVMPGITGWAQINYKYGDTIEDTIIKLEYDLYYIKHLSASFDFFIMFHTVKTMLMFRGAQ
jgi:sugar transferase (PEP-CTERM system associated)